MSNSLAKAQNQGKKKSLNILFIIVIVLAVLIVGGACLLAFLDSRNNADKGFTLEKLTARMNEINAALDESYRTQGSLNASDFKVWEDYPTVQGEEGNTYSQYIYLKSDSLALIVSLDENKNVTAFSVKSDPTKYKDNLYLAAGYEQQAAIAANSALTPEAAKELTDKLIDKITENTGKYDEMSETVYYGINCDDTDFSLYTWWNQKAFDDLGYFAAERTIFEPPEPTTEQTTFTVSGTDSVKSNKGGTITFSSAMSINSDVVGWLGIADTYCTGPVVQTSNNDFYLNHDLYKNYYVHGSRYADFRCNFENGNLSQNTTIYGHYNDSRLIFADLTKYTSLSFYKEHPIIRFDTKYEQAYWKVFAVFITNTNSADGAIFEYRDPEFATQEQFLYFIERVKRRSVIDTGVDVIENDRILTLSTCSRVLDDCRLVVMARKVRAGEIPGIVLSEVKYADNPLFPDAFYKKKLKAYKPYWYGPDMSSYSKPNYDDEP